MWKFYDKVHGVMRAKLSHPNVMFRYMIGPEYTVPNKINPTEFTEEKTRFLLKEGESMTNSTIQQLLKDPEAEL